jgi:hypothetical protein
MQLIVVYIVFIVVGDVIAYGLARVVDKFSATASLPVFLALYFGVFWLGWILAVRVTASRAEVPAKT